MGILADGKLFEQFHYEGDPRSGMFGWGRKQHRAA
jgi:hypothetical protein